MTTDQPSPTATAVWATLHPDWPKTRLLNEGWQHVVWTFPTSDARAIADQAWRFSETSGVGLIPGLDQAAEALTPADAVLAAVALAFVSRYQTQAVDGTLVALNHAGLAQEGDGELRLVTLWAGGATDLSLAALSRSMARRVGPPMDGKAAGSAAVAILVGARFESLTPAQTSALEAVLALVQRGEHVDVRLSLPSGTHAPDRPQRMLAQWQALVRQAAADPGMPIKQAAFLPDAERAALLALGCGPVRHWAGADTLHGGFEAQALRTPLALAAIHGARTVTYAALDSRAERLARRLLALGIPRGGFVALLLPRGLDFLAAMLGVMKAGAAFLPLDPTYPRERVMEMLRDSAAACVVCDETLQRRYSSALGTLPDPPRLLLVDAADGDTLAEGMDLPRPQLQGQDRAYMIYTSGSSGRPKGAICRHDGALNHLWGELEGLGLQSAFRFLQSAPSSSDISVWQFLAPLQLGGACVIIDREAVVDPSLLLATLQKHAVSVAEPIPSVLRALLDHLDQQPGIDCRLPALRCMMCSGEAMPPDLVGRWFQRYPQIPLANTYGPTEASDDVTLLVLDRAVKFDGGAVPIGRPLPNLQLLLLDTDQQFVPLGAVGEVCVTGVGVGEGYWRQPEKTAAAFLPSPVPDVPGLLYRTGDLGRWRPDGLLEYLGRLDQQLKVRGHRVEPGEVEQAVREHPDVADAAVVAITGTGGAIRLHAAYTCLAGASVAPQVLRRFLADRLPGYMIPASWAQHTELPRTPMGKLDRAELQRRADSMGSASRDEPAPASDTVVNMLGLAWERALGLVSINPEDHFFEIGGDSLSTVAVTIEAARLGIHLTPSQIFEHPRLADLAASVERAAGQVPRRIQGATRVPGSDVGHPPIGQAWRDACKAALEAACKANSSIEAAYPLSPTQRDMFFQLLLTPRHSGVYIEQVAFVLHGLRDGERLAQAWQQTVDRIDMLRTGITRVPGQLPMQFVQAAALCEVCLLDHRELSETESAAALGSIKQAERGRGFDLKRPPLMRVVAMRQSDATWRLLWTYHHLVLDGQSEALVLRIFIACCTRGSLAQADPAPGPATAVARFRDLLGWLDGRDDAATEPFWKEQLSGYHPSRHLIDSASTTADLVPAISHGTITHAISPALQERVSRWQRRHGLTAATLLHGAWAQVLHRRTGCADVMLGSVSSGRQAGFSGLSAICGPVLVTLPLRSTLAAGVDTLTWLGALQLRLARLREHEHTPLTQIVSWCGPGLGRQLLFDSMVVQAHFAGDDAGLRTAALEAGVEIEDFTLDTQPAYGLTLVAVEQPERQWRLVYERRRFSPSFAESLLRESVQWLAALVSQDDDTTPCS